MKKAILFLGILPCFAENEETASTRLIWENDICFHQDANYTNGAQIQFLSAADKIGTKTWLPTLMGMKESPKLLHQWGLSLTQYMFTPEVCVNYPVLDQRPFAGFLALGYANIVKDDTRTSSLEIQLGVTGDSSGAQGLQNAIHKAFRIRPWNWNYNLPSEVTFQIYYKRYYRFKALESENFLGMETDGFCFWSTDLGTVYLRAGLGGQVRFGYNLPGIIASPGIAGASYSSQMFEKKRKSTSIWSLYGVGAIGARVVGRDMFLDGTVFHSHPKYVGSTPLVGEASMGVVIARKSVELGVYAIYRSAEYRQQNKGQWITSAELRWNY